MTIEFKTWELLNSKLGKYIKYILIYRVPHKNVSFSSGLIKAKVHNMKYELTPDNFNIKSKLGKHLIVFQLFEPS